MNADEVIQAYRNAAGRWRGCDWPTAFENQRLDLNGVSANQANMIANAVSGSESLAWRKAASYLIRVEESAKLAEQEARIAYELAVADQAGCALPHAREAVAIESQHHHHGLVWGPLLNAIEALAGLECGPVGRANGSTRISNEVVFMPWTMQADQ